MNCSEIRLEIEKIEDLRNPGHKLPPEVSAHLEECEACAAYHKASCKLENHLFSEIKNVEAPSSGIEAILKKQSRFNFRRMRFLVPAAAAVLVLASLSIFFLTHDEAPDLTKNIVKEFLSNTISFNDVYAEETGSVISSFNEKTGLSAELPEEINAADIKGCCLSRIDGEVVAAFKCRKGNEDFTFFMYTPDKAVWHCCCEKRCLCLSTDSMKVMRWKTADAGFLLVEKMHGNENCSECHSK